MSYGSALAGEITIGGKVIGGTPNDVLFTNASGNIGQDDKFKYIQASHTLALSNSDIQGTGRISNGTLYLMDLSVPALMDRYGGQVIKWDTPGVVITCGTGGPTILTLDAGVFSSLLQEWKGNGASTTVASMDYTGNLSLSGSLTAGGSSIFGTNVYVSGYIVDGSNLIAIDVNNRTLYYPDGVTPSYNWASSEAFDVTGTPAVVWSSSNGVQFNNGISDWANAFISINTNLRRLHPAAGWVSVDWENLWLNGINWTALDWGAGLWYDNAQAVSVDAQNRAVKNASGVNLGDWSTAAFKVPHLGGSTSTPTTAAGAGAGTSPTIAITGTDISGVLSVTTGTFPTGTNAVVVTVTFNVAYASAPTVVLYPNNAITATLSGVSMVFTTSTTTTFVVTSGTTALTAATAYKWFYQVIQ